MNESRTRGALARRLIFRPAAALAVLTSLTGITCSATAYAQAPASMATICASRANNARLIAQDRDAGISKEQERRKTQAVVAALSPERQAYALAETSSFIDGLYGRYAKLPPQQVYTKYLAYCEGQASGGGAARTP
ncbi:hypothetical protein [Paraburkholderia sp. BCC1885]|uniref:hypothetical protein n=1 Tax=Paraburkholderia sp. BCC1885 TaxID=2562669 RepID=UPI0011822055|nr:hypothetical protein [Paraburkholderia sp. BCC1885]